MCSQRQSTADHTYVNRHLLAPTGYAIIVDEKGEIHERWMEGPGNPGTADLPPTITKVFPASTLPAPVDSCPGATRDGSALTRLHPTAQVSAETKGTTRTVVLSRALAAGRYTFTAAALQAGLPISSALGAAAWANGQSYHDHTAAAVLTVGGGTPIEPPTIFDPKPWYKAHGILMTLAFAVLMPFARNHKLR